MVTDCLFVSDVVGKLHPPGTPVVTFSGSGSDEDDTFLGDLSAYPELLAWATDRCVPLVREITFAVSGLSKNYVSVSKLFILFF